MASDIVMRLRRWLELLGINTSGGQLLDEAAAEIARLVAEVERHRMAEVEREILALVKETADAYSDSHVSIAVQAYLDRTAPPAAS